MTNFAELLYRSLPGLYRDKDAALELRRFLDLAALPLEEIERSIGELYLDFYLNTCRDAFVPLIDGFQPTSWRSCTTRVSVGVATKSRGAYLLGCRGPLCC